MFWITFHLNMCKHQELSTLLCLHPNGDKYLHKFVLQLGPRPRKLQNSTIMFIESNKIEPKEFMLGTWSKV